jgi:hypothetical protein
MKAMGFSETSVLKRAIRRNIPDDGILHIKRRLVSSFGKEPSADTYIKPRLTNRERANVQLDKGYCTTQGAIIDWYGAMACCL